MQRGKLPLTTPVSVVTARPDELERHEEDPGLVHGEGRGRRGEAGIDVPTPSSEGVRARTREAARLLHHLLGAGKRRHGGEERAAAAAGAGEDVEGEGGTQKGGPVDARAAGRRADTGGAVAATSQEGRLALECVGAEGLVVAVRREVHVDETGPGEVLHRAAAPPSRTEGRPGRSVLPSDQWSSTRFCRSPCVAGRATFT